MPVLDLMQRTLLVMLLALTLPCAADEAPDYSGQELYQVFCASCHGPQAQGNGPAAKSLKVKVPDLTHIARRHGGTFPSDAITGIVDGRDLQGAHGTRDMPVWGQAFYGYSGDDPARRERANLLINRLVEYLRSIQR